VTIETQYATEMLLAFGWYGGLRRPRFSFFKKTKAASTLPSAGAFGLVTI
jgi:hypothetical protein